MLQTEEGELPDRALLIESDDDVDAAIVSNGKTIHDVVVVNNGCCYNVYKGINDHDAVDLACASAITNPPMIEIVGPSIVTPGSVLFDVTLADVPITANGAVIAGGDFECRLDGGSEICSIAVEDAVNAGPFTGIGFWVGGDVINNGNPQIEVVNGDSVTQPQFEVDVDTQGGIWQRMTPGVRAEGIETIKKYVHGLSSAFSAEKDNGFIASDDTVNGVDLYVYCDETTFLTGLCVVSVPTSFLTSIARLIIQYITSPIQQPPQVVVNVFGAGVANVDIAFDVVYPISDLSPAILNFVDAKGSITLTNPNNLTFDAVVLAPHVIAIYVFDRAGSGFLLGNSESEFTSVSELLLHTQDVVDYRYQPPVTVTTCTCLCEQDRAGCSH
eukprot:GHVN01019807.1.p1 GENE.GHVN01019807.1~~GHVN01019807.1.p1  ORF type:complete len:385 (+),score=62.34 GHVN01019807.1:389-1543(+)